MSFTPDQDGPIRVRFDSDLRLYLVEQRFRRQRNGKTLEHTVDNIPEQGELRWKPRARCTSMWEVVLRCFDLMYTENRALVAFDLGPFNIQSAQAGQIRAALQTVLL